MCNDYRLLLDIATIADDFEGLKIRIRMPEGAPNVQARQDIRMTDMAPIVRTPADGQHRVGELVSRRWGWPGKSGPVYNFRTEGFGGRPPDLSVQRCLILADGFYEFTDPEVPRPKDKRLDKWLFTMKDHDWFCIAGIWRDSPVGQCFSMLTMDAGEEIAPYHNRQIIPLTRDQWADWLNSQVPAQEILRSLPAGSLVVKRLYPPPGRLAQATLSL
ncbi:SOS response-associated peptidase family protein [Sphingobium lignivorans]|uniref:Abasic site processing protein n=1 Tax=Sphingobium lignivorans TaxID=2735886 RepID=A0ABR6NH24_9SPHN|nr:SOS response-associated peptidase [Sphingobium lignivorans]MBB5986585.1 putative SOS response-associated peptidase YedK [Sphingobium lignivorans]